MTEMVLDIAEWRPAALQGLPHGVAHVVGAHAFWPAIALQHADETPAVECAPGAGADEQVDRLQHFLVQVNHGALVALRRLHDPEPFGDLEIHGMRPFQLRRSNAGRREHEEPGAGLRIAELAADLLPIELHRDVRDQGVGDASRPGLGWRRCLHVGTRRRRVEVLEQLVEHAATMAQRARGVAGAVPFLQGERHEFLRDGPAREFAEALNPRPEVRAVALPARHAAAGLQEPDGVADEAPGFFGRSRLGVQLSAVTPRLHDGHGRVERKALVLRLAVIPPAYGVAVAVLVDVGVDRLALHRCSSRVLHWLRRVFFQFNEGRGLCAGGKYDD